MGNNSVKTSKEKMEAIFSDDPLAGAAYLGEIAKISIQFGEADEAGVRATLAAHLANRVPKLEGPEEVRDGE